MPRRIAAKITAVAGYVPPRVMSNAELEKLVETSDEWIRERTGIRERRIAQPLKNLNEQNSSLAALAASRALEMANKRAEDIDLILYATCTPDTLIPSTACWLQKKIGSD